MRHVKWLVGAALVVMTTGLASAQDAHGHAEEYQGHRHDHARPPRILDSVLLSTTTSSSSIGYSMDICMNIVEAVKKELKLSQARRQAHAGDVGDAHSVDRKRHGRSRMRLDNEQRRAAEAGRLHEHAFRHREPLRLQEIGQQSTKSTISRARRSSRRRAPPISSRSPRSTRKESRHDHPDRQGSLRCVPDGRNRPRRRVRDGRHHHRTA